jgi:dipeptidyl aminopeptidase/acylaminoacyl peptidase
LLALAPVHPDTAAVLLDRLTRLRGAPLAVGVAGLVLCGASAVSAISGSGGSSRHPHTGSTPAAGTSSPTVTDSVHVTGDARPLTGRGELAFISDGRVFLLGGAVDRLTPVSVSAAPTAVDWSADGDWLAVTTTTAGSNPRNSVSLYSAEGALVRSWSATDSSYADGGWSPAGDQLALLRSPWQASGAVASTEQLLVTGPHGRPTELTSVQVPEIAWSPSGTQIAASVTSGRHPEQVRVFPVDGKPARTVASATNVVYLVAGWWPDGNSLLVWRDPQGSSSIATDGIPLLDLPLSGGRPRQLVPRMLTHTSWISTSAVRNDIAVIAGGDRELTQGNKSLNVCTIEACRAVPQRPGTVSLDPAFGPSGQLAVVRDRAVIAHGYGAAYNRTVEDSGGLTIVDGDSTSPLAGTPRGATVPQWGIDGSLLFVRHNVIWLLADGASHAERVAGPLTVDEQPGSYGFVPWLASISWSGAARTSLGSS